MTTVLLLLLFTFSVRVRGCFGSVYIPLGKIKLQGQVPPLSHGVPAQAVLEEAFR